MALTIHVDCRGHEPRLAELLRPYLDRESMKRAVIEVAQIPVGDVFWSVGPHSYAIERKALSARSSDMAQSFSWGKGRLRSQLQRMQRATVGGRSILLVEGDIMPGPGGYIYDREATTVVGYPLTWAVLDGIMWRLRMLGLIAERTRDMDETARVIARLVWLSTHPTRWLQDAVQSGST